MSPVEFEMKKKLKTREVCIGQSVLSRRSLSRFHGHGRVFLILRLGCQSLTGVSELICRCKKTLFASSKQNEQNYIEEIPIREHWTLVINEQATTYNTVVFSFLLSTVTFGLTVARRQCLFLNFRLAPRKRPVTVMCTSIMLLRSTDWSLFYTQVHLCHIPKLIKARKNSGLRQYI